MVTGHCVCVLSSTIRQVSQRDLSAFPRSTRRALPTRSTHPRRRAINTLGTSRPAPYTCSRNFPISRASELLCVASVTREACWPRGSTFIDADFLEGHFRQFVYHRIAPRAFYHFNLVPPEHKRGEKKGMIRITVSGNGVGQRPGCRFTSLGVMHVCAQVPRPLEMREAAKDMRGRMCSITQTVLYLGNRHIFDGVKAAGTGMVLPLCLGRTDGQSAPLRWTRLHFMFDSLFSRSRAGWVGYFVQLLTRKPALEVSHRKFIVAHRALSGVCTPPSEHATPPRLIGAHTPYNSPPQTKYIKLDGRGKYDIEQEIIVFNPNFY